MTMIFLCNLLLAEEEIGHLSSLRKYVLRATVRWGYYADLSEEEKMTQEYQEWLRSALRADVGPILSFEIAYPPEKRSGIDPVFDREVRELWSSEFPDFSEKREFLLRLFDRAPRPLAQANVAEILAKASIDDPKEAKALERLVDSCLARYSQTTFSNLLREIWTNPSVSKGLFVYAEGPSPSCVFDISFDDMLLDIWMHNCFGWIEEDVAYRVEKN